MRPRAVQPVRQAQGKWLGKRGAALIGHAVRLRNLRVERKDEFSPGASFAGRAWRAKTAARKRRAGFHRFGKSPDRVR